jgi:hypothetical protein
MLEKFKSSVKMSGTFIREPLPVEDKEQRLTERSTATNLDQAPTLLPLHRPSQARLTTPLGVSWAAAGEPGIRNHQTGPLP